jgi:C4-dicarboxylate-specific signal transduction histidine kinase
MLELSYHILDLVQNALTAGASRVSIQIREDRAEGLLTIEVEDNGRGMKEETARRAANPFVTSRKESGIGLGLSLL